MSITIENFGEHNRDRHIGNSLYRICKSDKGQWYIHETYSDKNEWSGYNHYYSDDLQFVIDKLNSFTKEKELISIMDRQYEVTA